MNVGCADALTLSDSFRLVTPGSLAVVSVAVVGFVGASIALVGRAVFGGQTDAAGATWRRPALAMAALFLVVFSAKLLLMRATPVTSPYWDQWDGEAALLIAPFSRCQLAWHWMFSLHNEHRVFFSRLLTLDLLMVNGQWDPRLEQVANAAIHAWIAVLVTALFWVAGRRRRLELLVLLCGLAFALPFSWENTLSGFQSAFYFLLLFSVLALWLTTTHRAGSGGWWLGWIAAVSGIFAAASGVVIPVAIAAVAALKLAGDRRDWGETLMNTVAAAVTFTLGVLVASPPLPHHASLRAATVADFIAALGHALAWPWTREPLFCFIMWAPCAVLFAAILLRRGTTTEQERLVAGVGAWTLLNAVALAYGRGAGGTPPASRYMDFLSLGFVANAIAIVAAHERARAGRAATRVAFVLAAWLLFAVVGTNQLVAASLGDVAVWRQYFAAHTSNVRRFVITDDLARFTARQPVAELPYPDPLRLATLLRDPELRRVLPASIREPIHISSPAVTNEAFVIGGSPVGGQDPFPPIWGSYAADGRASAGRFESQAMPGCSGRNSLQFQLSGYLGLPRHDLAVKDLASGRETPVRPAVVPGEGWLQKAVPCPAGRFAIVAVDANPDSWFAFREPVEVGWASLLSERLIARSQTGLFAALALALVAVGWRWVPMAGLTWRAASAPR